MPATTQRGSRTGSAEKFFAITPDDSNDLPDAISALIVQSAGTVKLAMQNGTTATLSLPADVFPLVATRVYATGTTATGLSGLV